MEWHQCQWRYATRRSLQLFKTCVNPIPCKYRPTAHVLPMKYVPNKQAYATCNFDCRTETENFSRSQTVTLYTLETVRDTNVVTTDHSQSQVVLCGLPNRAICSDLQRLLTHATIPAKPLKMRFFVKLCGIWQAFASRGPSAAAELPVCHSLSCLNIVHKRSGGDTWRIADNIWWFWSNDSYAW